MNARQDEVEAQYRAVEAELLRRWPETRLEPSRDRIEDLMDLLGSPQRSYPSIHITGTNGKTSTARMIDALLRALNLRTGRTTSPHLEQMRERICLDGEPISRERFVEVYRDVQPFAELVDKRRPHPLSFFEMITGMAYAAFADAPVDAAVVEVGLGGSWDSTNVIDAQVAVITPISLDHTHLLGDTVEDIAWEKSGIIKRDALAVLAQQPVEAAQVLLRQAAEVGATVAREGIEFGVMDRQLAVGGQRLVIRGLSHEYDEVHLPLYGAHQAHNAACAIAAVEAFLGAGAGGATLEPDLVREAMAVVRSPGRLEVVRRSPTVLIDAAHNPGGALATAEAIAEEFAFDHLVGVIAAMQDKDVRGLLEAFEPVLAEVVITRNSTQRAMPVRELAEIAGQVFGAERVTAVDRLDDAIERAIALAEGGVPDASLGGSGVLITGSVVTAGEAGRLLRR
ncbi:bifunctional folylpolyglutamate synthase/dihydrofolate synthase [Actinocrinis puniceicyclus]|uniref:Dihydrofolate synthase/folylpolyglutamate synthase n=1 Tax=Actinocrinis puniceicyclus TaxID=977794 RepID=A0A8J7WKA8_9ACTN|nr:folylpolyglutamate synthase/dihydrofolate synthase family protein [Actinocrinis puniceicyclus]MBS2961692.1 bifunctional folylpolyglutamate synthase/dihydrofolate synthase [Actinocrinis puniceicyclus]